MTGGLSNVLSMLTEKEYRRTSASAFRIMIFTTFFYIQCGQLTLVRMSASCNFLERLITGNCHYIILLMLFGIFVGKRIGGGDKSSACKLYTAPPGI